MFEKCHKRRSEAGGDVEVSGALLTDRLYFPLPVLSFSFVFVFLFTRVAGVFRSDTRFGGQRFQVASFAEYLVHEANNIKAVRRVLKETAAWWRRGPVILMRARVIKQLDKQTSPMNNFDKSRAFSAGIDDSGGSGGDFTLTEDAGRGARDNGTTRNVEVGVGDGDIDVKRACEAGRTSGKRVMYDVVERLVALGIEEDGVFRHVIMFV